MADKQYFAYTVIGTLNLKYTLAEATRHNLNDKVTDGNPYLIIGLYGDSEADSHWWNIKTRSFVSEEE